MNKEKTDGHLHQEEREGVEELTGGKFLTNVWWFALPPSFFFFFFLFFFSSLFFFAFIRTWREQSRTEQNRAESGWLVCRFIRKEEEREEGRKGHQSSRHRGPHPLICSALLCVEQRSARHGRENDERKKRNCKTKERKPFFFSLLLTCHHHYHHHHHFALT